MILEQFYELNTIEKIGNSKIFEKCKHFSLRGIIGKTKPITSAILLETELNKNLKHNVAN